MAPWHCCILLVCLLSPLKAEADDREWKEEMDKQLKKVLSIVEEQAQEIMTLKTRINVLETMREETEMRLASSIRETETNISHIAKKLDEQSLTLEGQQKRLLINSINEGTAVAFYAYISKDFTHIGNGHVFVFDTVVTNRGNAYNNYSGIFTVPSSGLYAFSYSIAVAGYHMSGDHDSNFGEISVQLVRNGSPCGSIAADTEASYDDEMATGFAILSLDAGDIVRVVSQNSGQGTFRSNTYEHWAFSGFKISS
uniref:Collagen alpha-1(X) chain-like n=1 Tax=Crassostrea virginica TaxID=6565 RepID=A0A8B8BA82_CRAVI|nr:collagen alpha-1(X) chain-like [Crassostrea virginica]